MRNFRNYEVWKRGIELAKDIYRLTEQFPKKERFGLSSQLQRAAVSVASNISEGASRRSDVEFTRYLEIAIGSCFEVETQLMIANEIGYLTDENLKIELDKVHVLQKQLNSFISKIAKG